jgi:Carboxypeptidase regulatory-like domain/TonB-dependent Receptor Plug Domain
VLAILLLGAVYLPLTPLAQAQEVSAGITGKVSDPSGAPIPGATVTGRDTQRGTEWPTITNEEGIYAFPRIPAGNYELRVEMQGFKTVRRPNIQLELNQRARVDMQMELGTISDSVEVVGAAPILNTDTTTVGSTITANSIVNTPLLTRNYIALTLLAPGVTTTNPAGFMNGQRTTGGGRPYVNGNRKEANNFLLDGVDNNHTSDNLTSYQPNLDAIQEVKMITNNASAEFGNFQGGVINVTIKSGTNDFHGTAFEFFRNDVFNANNWARNWNLAPDPETGKAPRAPIRWNEFGGTIGGPIKKDKIFFFGDYQGIRRAIPTTVNTFSVIPAEFRNGDFSRLLTEQNIQLYDPLTTDAAGNRQPFVNNQIPVTRRNIVATNLFSSPDLYPLPVNGALRFNQFNATRSQLVSDQFDAKVDAKLSGKDDFSARYSWGRQETPGQNSFPVVFDTFNHSPFQNGVLNWTRTVSPTVVNEARFGANRIVLWNGGEDKGLGNVAEALGIQQGNDRGPRVIGPQLHRRPRQWHRQQ